MKTLQNSEIDRKTLTKWIIFILMSVILPSWGIKYLPADEIDLAVLSAVNSKFVFIGVQVVLMLGIGLVVCFFTKRPKIAASILAFFESSEFYLRATNSELSPEDAFIMQIFFFISYFLLFYGGFLFIYNIKKIKEFKWYGYVGITIFIVATFYNHAARIGFYLFD